MKLKTLKNYQVGGTRSKMQLAIPLPQTPEGRVYRYSPNEEAHPRHFVLGDSESGFVLDQSKRGRMKQEPGSPKTICPYSGVIGDDDDFTHPKDREAALKIVEHAAMQDVQNAFSDMLKGVAKKSRGGISYKPGKRANRPKPRFGRRDLMRLLICDCCGRDYGVFAIALYCPDCGAPNIALHFARESELVLQQVDLAEGLGRSQQELAYRLLGNAHEDVLTAFEAVQKAIYINLSSSGNKDGVAGKPVRNDFQNIEKAKKRYAEFDLDPFTALSDSEYKMLELNIQKRHVIGHNLGVMDAKFIENARDARIGETVELIGTDIKDFCILCQKVIQRLDDWIAGVGSSSGSRSDVKTNNHREPEIDDVILSEQETFASRVGRWLCEQSANGLPDHVDEEAIHSAFADMNEADLEEALAELEMDGCAQLSHVIGSELPRIRTTEEFFLTFDPIVLGSNPLEDALQLVELVLRENESISVSDLHRESCLDVRRFNPAMGLVLGEISDGQISGEYSSDYPARSFALVAEDRVALKRFRKRLQQ